MIGYDTGVISGALVTIGSDLGPAALSDGQKVLSAGHVLSSLYLITQTSHFQEFITSATTLGALLGGLAAGAISDFVGRRPVLGVADIIFIGGAIAQAVCHTVWSMVSIVWPRSFQSYSCHHEMDVCISAVDDISMILQAQILTPIHKLLLQMSIVLLLNQILN
jgi:MFS family permease